MLSKAVRKVLAALVLLLAPAVAFAGEVEVYASARYLEPLGDAAGGLAAASSTGWGGGVGLGPWPWGRVELDFMRAELPVVSAGWPRSGIELDRAPVDVYALLLNLRLYESERLEVYFGPVAGYAEIGELAGVPLEDELAIGVSGAVAVRVGGPVVLRAGLRYLDLEIRRGLGSLEVDPIVASAGLGLRFGRP